MPAPLLAALSGLGLGLSLIVAIGAQNAFLLRQGLRREHVLPVVVVCVLSDVALTSAGIGGAGALFDAVPWLVPVVRYAGAAFLAVYGLLALRRAVRPASGLVAASDASGARMSTVVLTALALTWLNPHVYLDTLVLLGSIGSSYGAERWWFAGGAMLASLVWFTALGFGAARLSPLFAKPVAWRILDGVIAAVMLGLAAALVLAP